MKCDRCRKDKPLRSIDEAIELCEDCIDEIENVTAHRIKEEQKRRNQRDYKYIIN